MSLLLVLYPGLIDHFAVHFAISSLPMPPYADIALANSLQNARMTLGGTHRGQRPEYELCKIVFVRHMDGCNMSGPSFLKVFQT